MVREALLKFQSPSIRLWWVRTAVESEFQQILQSDRVREEVSQSVTCKLIGLRPRGSETKKLFGMYFFLNIIYSTFIVLKWEKVLKNLVWFLWHVNGILLTKMVIGSLQEKPKVEFLIGNIIFSRKKSNLLRGLTFSQFGLIFTVLCAL